MTSKKSTYYTIVTCKMKFYGNKKTRKNSAKMCKILYLSAKDIKCKYVDTIYLQEIF